MAQGDVSNAKDDTRLLATGAAIINCTTDLSHQADNLTAGAGWVSEADSARWDEATLPLAVDVVCTANSTDTGYLYSHENALAGLRVSIAAGPVVEVRVNAVLVASVAVTGIAGSREGLVISWSMEANPFTTGAADAVRSEVHVFNTTDGTHFQAAATHEVPVNSSGAAVWGARTTAGGNVYSGVMTTIRWSVGRFHPAAESREDFVGLTAAPSLAFGERREVPVPTRDSGVGAHGYFAGPIYQAAAAALGQVDIRQASPAVSELYRDVVSHDNTPSTVRSWPSPDGDGFTFFGMFLVRHPVPKTCNRLQVRVHLQCYRVDVALPDDVLVRCYSMKRPPGPGIANKAGQVAWTRFYQEVTVNSVDGSGTTGGDVYTFDPLWIARDRTTNFTWLALAFLVEDANGGGIADQRWRVRSWMVEPGAIDSAGELPLGGLG